MRYEVKQGITVKTYTYLSDFIRDEIDDEDVVEFINDVYVDSYPLPPMLKKITSLGKIMKEYVSGADWSLWYDDLIMFTIEALEEELEWADEDKNGVKTITWKNWVIQQYN